MKQKIFTSLLFATIICTTAIAQPVIKAQKAIGGSLDDNLTCMALIRDGGLIIGGYSDSDVSYEKTENSRGVADYWIVKLSSLGNILWNKTLGGNDQDFLNVIKQSADGGYILGGGSYSSISGEKTENSRGDEDYWVIKLDSFGNIQWDKTIGGSGGEILSSLQQTSDGGYILAGSSYSNISGEKTENNRGIGYDYWLVKLDSAGNIQWNKTIGGNSNDALNAVQQTIDGGYILGGYSFSDISYEKTENTRGVGGRSDYWVVKLDSSGNIQWDKTIGGNRDDYLTSLQQTSDGGYILGGTSDSNIFGEKTQNKRGLTDYWVVKLDISGNIQWDKTIGGNDLEALYSILQTRDGGYILGGYSLSNISGEKTENARGEEDYWAVKLGSDGNIQGDKTIGGSASDFLTSISEIGKYHYVLGGYSTSGKSGDKTQFNRGYRDYWLVELAYTKPGSLEITSAQDANNAKAGENNNTKIFSAFPNPAKDILHILTNGKATFTLTNQSGKILLTKTITNKGEINLANLAGGLYYLKNNTTGVVQKVMKTK